MGAYAQHTAIDVKGRWRKGSEPSRRLSEPTDPQPSRTFRIACWRI